MEYELRKLKSDDIFVITSIISKIGYKEFKHCFNSEDLKAIAQEGGSKVDTNALGMTVAFDVLGIILENMVKVKDEIYSFLASLSGMAKKDIAELPMATFAEMLVEVVKKEEFTDFFQVAAKLFK